MTRRDAMKLSDSELRALLLTADGKGKTEKEIALEELLERKYAEGWDNGKSNGMLDVLTHI